MSNQTQSQTQDQRLHQAKDQALRQQQAEPGSELPNPAEPYASTRVPERLEAKAFMREGFDPQHPPGYPKMRYHPVHGGVIVQNAGEEGGLEPKTDWFDTPELADAARTWTEAEIVRQHNLREKLKTLDDRGLKTVRNSVQADEALRNAKVEPL